MNDWGAFRLDSSPSLGDTLRALIERTGTRLRDGKRSGRSRVNASNSS
jgi:hypothetical protein